MSVCQRVSMNDDDEIMVLSSKRREMIIKYLLSLSLSLSLLNFDSTHGNEQCTPSQRCLRASERADGRTDGRAAVLQTTEQGKNTTKRNREIKRADTTYITGVSEEIMLRPQNTLPPPVSFC